MSSRAPLADCKFCRSSSASAFMVPSNSLNRVRLVIRLRADALITCSSRSRQCSAVSMLNSSSLFFCPVVGPAVVRKLGCVVCVVCVGGATRLPVVVMTMCCGTGVALLKGCMERSSSSLSLSSLSSNSLNSAFFSSVEF